jgi:hypothetical protein
VTCCPVPTPFQLSPVCKPVLQLQCIRDHMSMPHTPVRIVHGTITSPVMCRHITAAHAQPSLTHCMLQNCTESAAAACKPPVHLALKHPHAAPMSMPFLVITSMFRTRRSALHATPCSTPCHQPSQPMPHLNIEHHQQSLPSATQAPPQLPVLTIHSSQAPAASGQLPHHTAMYFLG